MGGFTMSAHWTGGDEGACVLGHGWPTKALPEEMESMGEMAGKQTSDLRQPKLLLFFRHQGNIE